MSYAIGVTDSNYKTLYSVLIKSEKELETLRTNLNEIIENDKKNIKKFHYYFPNTTRATKIKNIVLRVFTKFIAFFFDLMSLPFYYSSRKQNLKNNLCIYKNLKHNKVPEKYLNTHEFFVYFLKSKIDKEGKKILDVENHSVLFQTSLFVKQIIENGKISHTYSEESSKRLKQSFFKNFVIV